MFLMRVSLCALILLAGAGGASAQERAPLLFRIFLQDGGTLVSYGEFARVANRVVLSIPLGEVADPSLQLVSIDDALVDWPRTDEYTLAVRARQFAETHGPAHFALLGGRVEEALHQIRLTPDPARRLAMAEEARRNLARWPVENFGYRADDVAQMVDLFDEVIAELRIASGQQGFDLRLSARTGPPEYRTLLAAPSARESFEQAYAIARLTTDPVEKTSLLEVIAASLRAPARDGGWAPLLHARVAADLAAERQVDRQYRELAARTMKQALARAARGDAPGIAALTRATLQADDRLGRRRPQEIAALLGYLDVQLEAARDVVRARQLWAERRVLFEQYRERTSASLEQLRASRSWLEAVRDGRPVQRGTLDRQEQRTVMARRVFELVAPPAELEAVQSLYTAAFHMARRAAAAARDAVSSSDALAREASSAAAGALMLLAQADEELARAIASPR